LIIQVLLVFAAVLVTTGFVGLATMSAATSLPIWLAITRLPADQPLFIYLAVMAGCVIYWHRSNIQRMLAGNENRNVKVMLFKPRQAPPGDDSS
jgi:glycerol-3-phosphate acyltransferase PlsY